MKNNCNTGTGEATGVPFGSPIVINSTCTVKPCCDTCLGDVTSSDGSVGIEITERVADECTGLVVTDIDLTVAGGGGGSQTWDTLPEKPFESIGDSLKADGEQLTTDLHYNTVVTTPEGVDRPLREAFELPPDLVTRDEYNDLLARVQALEGGS